jgi:gliding motility-associated protein GldL
MNLSEIVQSKRYKRFMAYVYGWGASIVLLGALFKINHYPGASVMLLIGLAIEALIFFLSAFEPLHEQYDWSLVYPELAGMDNDEDLFKDTPAVRGGTNYGGSLADQILEKAEVSKETLDKLGSGLTNLAKTTSALSDVSEATVVTKEYIDSAKMASNTMQGISKSSESYQELAQTLQTNFVSVQNQSSSYSTQLESMNKNLAALNTMYEVQLKGTNQYVKNSETAYTNLNSMMDNLMASVESTKKYRDEVSKLGEKLEALNTVYGNMLSAMNIKK